MKKTVCLILSVIFALGLLSACSSEYKEPPEVGFLVADQFTGYKLGTVTDLVPKKVITDNIDSPDVVNFSSVEKGLDALRNKKIHGFVLPAVYMANETQKSDDFVPTRITFIEKRLCAISLSSFELSMNANAALTRIKRDGTMQKIANAHSPYADESDPYVRPTDYEKIEDRVITIGICSEEAFPYNYRDSEGNLAGINVDVAHEIAKGARAELIIKEFKQDELMPALDSGDADMVMSQFFEDEKNPISSKYLYSHQYCDASTYIVIRSPQAILSDTETESAE